MNEQNLSVEELRDLPDGAIVLIEGDPMMKVAGSWSYLTPDSSRLRSGVLLDYETRVLLHPVPVEASWSGDCWDLTLGAAPSPDEDTRRALDGALEYLRDVDPSVLDKRYEVASAWRDLREAVAALAEVWRKRSDDPPRILAHYTTGAPMFEMSMDDSDPAFAPTDREDAPSECPQCKSANPSIRKTACSRTQLTGLWLRNPHPWHDRAPSPDEPTVVERAAEILSVQDTYVSTPLDVAQALAAAGLLVRDGEQ